MKSVQILETGLESSPPRQLGPHPRKLNILVVSGAYLCIGLLAYLAISLTAHIENIHDTRASELITGIAVMLVVFWAVSVTRVLRRGGPTR